MRQAICDGASMPQESNKHSSLAVVLLIAVLIPMLYVLSIGPTWALAYNGVISIETHDTIYAPVKFICSHPEHTKDDVDDGSSWVEKQYYGYLTWWEFGSPG